MIRIKRILLLNPLHSVQPIYRKQISIQHKGSPFERTIQKLKYHKLKRAASGSNRKGGCLQGDFWQQHKWALEATGYA